MSSWSTPGGDDHRSRAGEPGVPQGRPPYGPAQGPPYGGPPQGLPHGATQGAPPAGPTGPSFDPYGTPYGPPGSTPWGTPAGYGGPWPPDGAPPYGALPSGWLPYGAKPPMTPGWRAGTTTLVVLSVLLTRGGWGLGLPGLIVSIVAMTRARTDGPSGTRLAKVGWVCFGVGAALVAAFWVFVLVVGTHRAGVPVPVEDI